MSKSCTLIAEVAQAHDGSLGMAHAFIDALSGTGVDVVKFQIHIADAESSPWERFRVPFSYEDATRMEYWKRMEFPEEEWAGLKKHCEECGMEFLATPFSIAAVEMLERLDVKRYKVGSGDVNNLLMLDRIASIGKPVLLSSGMSSWEELDRAIAHVQKHHSLLSLMHCTTAYPCPPERCGLATISGMKQRYSLPVGYSDHSGTLFAGLGAVALGAELLEFHVCFDRRMFGPDAKASLTIDEVRTLAEGVRFLEKAIAVSNFREDASEFDEWKTLFGRSLSTNTDLAAGTVILKQVLETRKPAGRGIPAEDYERLLGKKLIRSLDAGAFINWSDVENG